MAKNKRHNREITVADINKAEQLKRKYSREALEIQAIRLGMDRYRATKRATKTNLADYIIRKRGK